MFLDQKVALMETIICNKGQTELYMTPLHLPSPKFIVSITVGCISSLVCLMSSGGNFDMRKKINKRCIFFFFFFFRLCYLAPQFVCDSFNAVTGGSSYYFTLHFPPQ